MLACLVAAQASHQAHAGSLSSIQPYISPCTESRCAACCFLVMLSYRLQVCISLNQPHKAAHSHQEHVSQLGR